MAPRMLAAQAADVIRGRVTGPDSLPVEGVNVTITQISTNINKNARTDKQGRFTVSFPGGDGDYMILFASLGYAARRFEVKRTADEEILVADTRLQKVAAQLDAMKVTGQRDKTRRDDFTNDISGTEKYVGGNSVSADLVGDLAAMAASMPGVQLIPSADGGQAGFSVLGLGADQNLTTLNGLPFNSSNVPRDANVQTSLITTPYDVSRGGFSGAQLNLRAGRGSNYIFRSMSSNVSAPQLQWTDRAGQLLGQQYTSLSLGGGVSGPIKYDKVFYNISAQFDRRMNDLHSLLNTDPIGLQAAGISSDSVVRLLSLVNAAHIPTTPGHLPQNNLNDRGSVFGSFDFMPPSPTSGQAFNVSFNGGWNKTNPNGLSTSDIPAHGGERSNWNGSIQGRHTDYFGFGILTETNVGFSQSHNSSNPYLDLPSGSVRVNSAFADGTEGLKYLSFGGNPSMSTSGTNTTASFSNLLSWFSADNKHRIKLSTELRRDAYAQDITTNQLGTFSYNSLADLQAGLPASFTRQLSPRTRSGSEYIAGVGLGDSYKRSADLQIQYGVRLDANHFAATPNVNPDVERVLGLANDHVPNRIYVSPRVGFSYTYGTAPQLTMFEGMIRGPRAVVRGGIGVFQNTPGASLIGSAIDNTGLPSAIQQLTCVGAAAPTADWAAYMANAGSIPTHCADGTAGTVFANGAPNVWLFDPNYRAQRSIRSNLQWNGMILGNRFNSTVEGTYSLNLNQQGSIDANLSATSQFNLADEAGRPVFVFPSSIVPATGAIASGDARVSPLFSRVTELVSDGKSESRQISFRISPFNFSSNFSWNATYVYSNVRDLVHGFNSTVGNPFDLAWGRSSGDSRHQLVYSAFWNPGDLLRLSWQGQFRSGSPFTPLIAGDVNGDGYSNDRAFIFDPAHAPDAALGAAMQTLLSSGSRTARDCLGDQVGHLAARSSCQGPWTNNATLSIAFNPMKVRMPQRATLSFQLSNPFGAADLLMHGESDLHGWGQNTFADPNLLYVRGFDPSTKRYKYEVNERFGSTNPAFSPLRTPVTLTAMVRVDVGPTREKQSLIQMINRGRITKGAKVTETQFKSMYGTGPVANPMATILRVVDTLKLTGPQADSIATLNRWFTTRMDSIWTPLAKYYAGLPDRFDEVEAYDRYREARESSVDLLIKIAPAVKGVIQPDQWRKLPSYAQSMLDPRYLASIRSGTAGAGMGAVMMMEGGAFAIMR